jgi:hypothetical protein
MAPRARKRMTKSRVFAVTEFTSNFMRGATKRAKAPSASVSMNMSETTRAAAECLRANLLWVPSTVCANAYSSPCVAGKLNESKSLFATGGTRKILAPAQPAGKHENRPVGLALKAAP